MRNAYSKIGDIVDAYWHRTMLFAAFDPKPLTTADQISARYPAASKYHIAVDVFSGLRRAGQQTGSSNHWGSNTREFTTGNTELICAPGDLLISAVATNTGPDSGRVQSRATTHEGRRGNMPLHRRTRPSDEDPPS